MPWVPRDLYDLMVNALRERGAVVSPVTPIIPEIRVVYVQPPVPEKAPAPTPAEPEPPALPDPLYAACVNYAFGNAAEEAANVARAVQLVKAGHKESDIIAEIRRGASVDAMFV